MTPSGVMGGSVKRVTPGHPRMIVDGRTVALAPVAFSDQRTTEHWLQAQLDHHPGLLPIDEISPAWGPLVSLGREIPLPIGFVDNLFVSPSGEITVVEAKLWRNPEARRQVVGQVLDYAAALAATSYEELEQAVNEAESANPQPIWKRVNDAVGGLDPQAEPGFIDTVSRNLRDGRFLLLVVGDGIRSDLESIAELIGAHPNLGFHLELVEMRLYRLPDDDALFVVPSIVGRTAEVRRAVVSVARDERGEVSVVVEAPPEEPHAGPGRFTSLEAFIARSTEVAGQARAEAMASLVEWWRTDRRSLVKFNKQSINLSSPYRHCATRSVSVATFGVNGLVQGCIEPMAEWRGIVLLTSLSNDSRPPDSLATPSGQSSTSIRVSSTSETGLLSFSSGLTI